MKTKQPVDPQNSRTFWNTRPEETVSAPLKRRRTSAVSRLAASAFNQAKLSTPSVSARTSASADRPAESGNNVELIEYNGHTLRVEAQRSGWKVSVFPNGSPFALHRIAYTSVPSERDAVIAQAKAMIETPRETPVLAPPEPAPVHPVPEPFITDVAAALSQMRDFLMQTFSKCQRSCGTAAAALKRAYFSIDNR